MSDLRQGLQHRDDFRAEVARRDGKPITIETFYRWKRRGLPTTNIGREPYVRIGPPYQFTAADWFANGMKAPAPPSSKPRRRRA